MKKLIIILAVIVGFNACNQSENTKKIQAKINKYKMEIVSIESKIMDLEKQLGDSILEASIGKILVGVEPLETQSFKHYLEVSGSVEAQQEAFISPEINGLIKSVNVEDGNKVRKGQTLATIDTEMIEKNIEELNTQLELANTIYNKQRELWNQKIGSEVQYLQAKSNKESLESKIITLQTQKKMATVTAPFDGIVEVVYQKAGEIGAPGRQILHLVSLQSLKVTADISESYLPYVHEGDTVIITFPTFPDITIQAPIKMVGSVVNPNNRTIKISSDVQNITNKLKPNIIAIIKIKDQEFNSALIIPSIVVKSDAKGQNYVYVVNNDSETTFAQKVFVKTGKSYENKTMVLSGLSVDQLLITQGYNLVKNGSLINVKN